MIRSRPRITEYTIKDFEKICFSSSGTGDRKLLHRDAQRICFTSLSLDETLNQISLLTLRRR